MVTDGTGREVDSTLQASSIAVTAIRDLTSPAPRIEVAQALGKGRKHHEVVRMLTEVGVDAVTAITTTRTQVDLSGKADRVQLPAWAPGRGSHRR